MSTCFSVSRSGMSEGNHHDHRGEEELRSAMHGMHVPSARATSSSSVVGAVDKRIMKSHRFLVIRSFLSAALSACCCWSGETRFRFSEVIAEAEAEMDVEVDADAEDGITSFTR